MHDISLYLLEMLENAVRARAGVVETRLIIDRREDRLELTVEDDGPGLDVTPEQATNPFYTTKRGKATGLGLSLFKAEAEAAGGAMTIGRSERLGGVAVRIMMRLGHVDRPPLGDVATSLLVMAATHPAVDFRVCVQDDEAGPPLARATVVEAAEMLARCTQELARGS